MSSTEKCALKCVDVRNKKCVNAAMKTMTITQMADYLGIPKRTLYDMIDDGRFPVPSIKSLYPRRWNVEDVDAWRLAQ